MIEEKTTKVEVGMDLKTSIIVSAVIIAGSLIYLGAQLGGEKAEFTTVDFDEMAAGYVERQGGNQAGAAAAAENQALVNEKAKNVEPISDKDYVLGNKDANITIFEYSDFECPYCKLFYETPSTVVDKSDGKVNTVFRHFPLASHEPLATKQANAIECAGDQGGSDEFYAYHDEIFARTSSGGRGMDESELFKIASDLKLDSKKFKACYDSEKFDAKVKDDIALGSAAGVGGTPGVIIRNNTTGEVRVMPGAVPIEMIESAISELSA
jgi:protein-disulfide isomerase